MSQHPTDIRMGINSHPLKQHLPTDLQANATINQQVNATLKNDYLKFDYEQKTKKQHKYLQVYKKALPLHTIPMRLWCNWQPRQTQDLMLHGVGVRVPSAAQSKKPCKRAYKVFQYIKDHKQHPRLLILEDFAHILYSFKFKNIFYIKQAYCLTQVIFKTLDKEALQVYLCTVVFS